MRPGASSGCGAGTDAVGSVRARVSISGPGGHSWTDRGRPSAVRALLERGAELLRHAGAETPVNIGLVSGGRSVNTIADRAELVVEMRALDEARLDACASELEGLAVAPPLSVSMHTLAERIDARSLDLGARQLEAVLRRLLGPA